MGKTKNEVAEEEKKDVVVEKAHEDDEDVLWVTEFDEKETKEFCDKLFKLSRKDPKKPIIIYIDSYGGAVDGLSAMVSAMESVPNKIVTVAMGKAMSCGAMLLSHGDIRYVAKHSRVMIHEVSAVSFGNINDMKTRTAEVNRENEYWMAWLAGNCGKAVKTLMKVFTNKKRDIYMDAEEAIAFGLADKIGIPKLTKVVRYDLD